MMKSGFDPLVLGITGSFGGAVGAELVRRGAKVVALVRDVEKAKKRFPYPDRVEWIEGDVQDEKVLRRAAGGVGAIVHGVNYPYDKWIPHMENATRNVIAAARGGRSLILFPGNVYGLGRQTGAPLTEETPNRKETKKGSLRVHLEDMLREAAEEGAVQVLIVRAGDYFGPTVRNGLVDPIFGNAARGKTIRALGDLDASHQWAYVPDLAGACVDLIEMREQLAAWEVVHFRGHVAERQRDFLRLVARQSGNGDLKINRVPWWLLRLAAPFDGVVRELLELRYLFDDAVILDDKKLRQLVPDYEPLPVDEAVRNTVESYR